MIQPARCRRLLQVLLTVAVLLSTTQILRLQIQINTVVKVQADDEVEGGMIALLPLFFCLFYVSRSCVR